MQEPLPYTTKENGILITIKVVPGSSRTVIVGSHGQMLKVKIAAPPEKGKANKELLDFLAKKLGLKKAALEIIAGHTNSVKQIFLEGASVEKIKALYEEKA